MTLGVNSNNSDILGMNCGKMEDCKIFWLKYAGKSDKTISEKEKYGGNVLWKLQYIPI